MSNTLGTEFIHNVRNLTWTRHITRRGDDRRSKATRRRNGCRNVRRSSARCVDDIVNVPTVDG